MVRFIFVMIWLLAMLGCASGPVRPAKINHPVFAKLKDPSQAEALIADCNERLRSIPGVTSYYCGRPLDTGRPSVDSNYDVGLYIGFDSEEDYAVYVAHPDHIWLVEKWQPRLEWLRVHDVLDESDTD